MKIQLANREYLDIKAFKRNMVMEMGSIIVSEDGDKTIMPEQNINLNNFESALQLIGINKLSYSEDIREYLNESKKFLRVTKLNNKVEYSYIDAYTDECTFKSEKFDDLINVALSSIFDKDLKICN